VALAFYSFYSLVYLTGAWYGWRRSLLRLYSSAEQAAAAGPLRWAGAGFQARGTLLTVLGFRAAICGVAAYTPNCAAPHCARRGALRSACCLLFCLHAMPVFLPSIYSFVWVLYAHAHRCYLHVGYDLWYCCYPLPLHCGNGWLSTMARFAHALPGGAEDAVERALRAAPAAATRATFPAPSHTTVDEAYRTVAAPRLLLLPRAHCAGAWCHSPSGPACVLVRCAPCRVRAAVVIAPRCCWDACDRNAVCSRLPYGGNVGRAWTRLPL